VWWQAEDGAEASLEPLVLRGDLSLEGERVGASGYTHLPQACGGGELRSETGALALVFWNPNMPAFPPPLTRNRALKLWEQPWEPSMPGSHFTMHKWLQLPDPAGGGYDGGPGGYLRLSYGAGLFLPDATRPPRVLRGDRPPPGRLLPCPYGADGSRQRHLPPAGVVARPLRHQERRADPRPHGRAGGLPLAGPRLPDRPGARRDVSRHRAA